jgi:hypothetical protein
MTDDDTVALMAEEILHKDPMWIMLDARTVLQLTGLVQLALRHPGVSEDLRAAGRRFIDAAQQYFADAPFVLDVIRRGDDPTEDR